MVFGAFPPIVVITLVQLEEVGFVLKDGFSSTQPRIFGLVLTNEMMEHIDGQPKEVIADKFSV